LSKANRATGRNNSVVNGCAGCSASVVDEATSEGSDAEGTFFNCPSPLIADGCQAIDGVCLLLGHFADMADVRLQSAFAGKAEIGLRGCQVTRRSERTASGR
jgi:hypothetical protein